MSQNDLEKELRALAHYHAGLFVGAASRLYPDPAAIAHALFLLIEVAEEQRQEWRNDPGAMRPPHTGHAK